MVPGASFGIRCRVTRPGSSRTAGVDARIGEAEASRHAVLRIAVARIEHVDDAHVRAQVAVRHAVVAARDRRSPRYRPRRPRGARACDARASAPARGSSAAAARVPFRNLAHLDAAAAAKDRIAQARILSAASVASISAGVVGLPVGEHGERGKRRRQRLGLLPVRPDRQACAGDLDRRRQRRLSPACVSPVIPRSAATCLSFQSAATRNLLFATLCRRNSRSLAPLGMTLARRPAADSAAPACCAAC